MEPRLRIALVDPEEAARKSLRALLETLDLACVETESGRYDRFAELVARTAPDIGIVSLDHHPQQALALIERLVMESPKTGILAISSAEDGQRVLGAMQAGAKEFLACPLEAASLADALLRIQKAREVQGDAKSKQGAVIAVAGAAGGIGTTTLAVNLGCALARNAANKTALADLDLALGDADLSLELIPDYTLADVTRNAGRLEPAALTRALTRHASGLYLLPRPVRLEDAASINAEGLERVLALLKNTFSHVVLDLSKRYGATDLTAIKAADHILLLAEPSLSCLRNLVRLLASLNHWADGVGDKVKIIARQAVSGRAGIQLAKIESILGKPVYWQLPSDSATIDEARAEGRPLIEYSPRSKLTRSLVDLCGALLGDSHPPSLADSSPRNLPADWRENRFVA